MSKAFTRQRTRALSHEPEKQWYDIRNAAEKSADVFVYGTIGGSWWDDESPSAAQFAKDLAALDVDTINLFVNSPGGSVYDGIAMRNSLKRHPANVIAHVDGIAASAASFLITGGDTVVMGQNTELMIHDALTYGGGNAADFRKAADELDSVSDNIASMYAAKAGGDPADWRALMIAETWYSAEEAVAAGLADSVADLAAADDVEDKFDLSMFAHAGRTSAPAPASIDALATLRGSFESPDAYLAKIRAEVEKRRPNRPAEPGSTTPANTQKGVDQMADLKKDIAARLGLKPDVELTDEVILAAVDEVVAEQPKPGVVIPEGTELVESGVLAELRRGAQDGEAARAQQVAERREAVVNKALREGKIRADAKPKWLAMLEANEESATEVLDTLAPGTVLPTKEIGNAGDAEAATDDDATYDKLWGSPTNTNKEA
jgi:ATP-dependent protease ClpP protease subunit